VLAVFVVTGAIVAVWISRLPRPPKLAPTVVDVMRTTVRGFGKPPAAREA
jgi:hypothetical protein